MTRTEKRLEVLSRQIDELKARIKTDTENLAEMEAEFDTLTAKKITEFAKKKNICIDDRFFEMLSLAYQTETPDSEPEEQKIFVPETPEYKKPALSVTDEPEEDKTNALF